MRSPAGFALRICIPRRSYQLDIQKKGVDGHPPWAIVLSGADRGHRDRNGANFERLLPQLPQLTV